MATWHADAYARQGESLPAVYAMMIYYPSTKMNARDGVRLTYFDDDSVSFFEANDRHMEFNLTRSMLEKVEDYVEKAKKWASKNTALNVDESQLVGKIAISNVTSCIVWFQAFKQGNSEISVHFKNEAAGAGFGLYFPSDQIDTLTNAWSKKNTYDKYMPEFDAKRPKKNFF